MESTRATALLDRFRTAYSRFAAGDPRLMSEFLGADVVYHLPGRHLGGGTIMGRAAVFERAAAAAASCDAPPLITLLQVTGCESFIASVERLVARRRGRTLDQEVCVVWRMVGTQCVEVWSHFTDQDA